MHCSEARIAANRANARKSTGPKTPEGKAISRANALKHGLCANVVVPEDPAILKERTTSYFWSLRPQNEYQCWMATKVAVLSVRIDRCERIERRCRDKFSLRAELCWDADRKIEAEVVGGLLSQKPSQTVETLKKTPHGCEWLMSRWAMLAHAADLQGNTWTEAQSALAFDLLATPPEFRNTPRPGALLDFGGHVLQPADDPAAVARRESAALMDNREQAWALDEVEQVLAMNDHVNDSDPELKKLRRYESALHTRMRWAVAQSQFTTPHAKSFPDLKPRYADEVEPAPKPEPKHPDEVAAGRHDPNSFSPPFCLDPHEFPEPGKKADIPTILKGRHEARLDKAQRRREARRRNAERLRG